MYLFLLSRYISKSHKSIDQKRNFLGNYDGGGGGGRSRKGRGRGRRRRGRTEPDLMREANAQAET